MIEFSFLLENNVVHSRLSLICQLAQWFFWNTWRNILFFSTKVRLLNLGPREPLSLYVRATIVRYLLNTWSTPLPSIQYPVNSNSNVIICTMEGGLPSSWLSKCMKRLVLCQDYRTLHWNSRRLGWQPLRDHSEDGSFKILLRLLRLLRRVYRA